MTKTKKALWENFHLWTGFLALVALVFLYYSYRLFQNSLFLPSVFVLVLSAFFLASALSKTDEIRNIIRIPIFFMIGGAILGNAVSSPPEELISIVVNVAIVIFLFGLGAVYLVDLRKKKKNHKWFYQKVEEQAKRFRGRVSQSLTQDAWTQIPRGGKLRIIGSISGCEPPSFDFIGVYEIGKKVIPFRIQAPIVLGELDEVPIVSILVASVGYDLCQITSGRDYSPSYNSSIFPDRDFRGYEFRSDDEYQEVKAEVLEGVKQLFLLPLVEEKSVAYCVEVGYVGQSWPYNYSNEDMHTLGRGGLV